MFRPRVVALAVACMLFAIPSASADENLFGYVKGAETLPKGSMELYNFVTLRSGKGQGKYVAVDTLTELEYGVSDSFSIDGAIKTMSIDTHGLLIDGYLPGPRKFNVHPSGIELGGKYNFLKPALDGIGLATAFSLEYSWIDPHSGQDKNKLSANLEFLLQKYFMEGRLIWVGNIGLESTYANRSFIPNLPPNFDWPTKAEMEIEITASTGLTYRFAPSWFLGVETQYQTEFETEIGQERWSLFLGPSLHYGGQKWWATLTYFPQLVGGREKYAGQVNQNLHLIEKTKREVRFKLGVNF